MGLCLTMQHIILPFQKSYCLFSMYCNVTGIIFWTGIQYGKTSKHCLCLWCHDICCSWVLIEIWLDSVFFSRFFICLLAYLTLLEGSHQMEEGTWLNLNQDEIHFQGNCHSDNNLKMHVNRTLLTWQQFFHPKLLCHVFFVNSYHTAYTLPITTASGKEVHDHHQRQLHFCTNNTMPSKKFTKLLKYYNQRTCRQYCNMSIRICLENMYIIFYNSNNGRFGLEKKTERGCACHAYIISWKTIEYAKNCKLVKWKLFLFLKGILAEINIAAHMQNSVGHWEDPVSRSATGWSKPVGHTGKCCCSGHNAASRQYNGAPLCLLLLIQKPDDWSVENLTKSENSASILTACNCSCPASTFSIFDEPIHVHFSGCFHEAAALRQQNHGLQQLPAARWTCGVSQSVGRRCSGESLQKWRNCHKLHDHWG